MSPNPKTLLLTLVSIVSGVAIGIAGYERFTRTAPVTTDMDTFERVLAQVRDGYVSEVREEELLDHALRGMLGGLDSHSKFLDNADYSDLQAETRGHFGGIGVELGLVDGYFTVVSPIHGTPAARAGLKPGDRIVAVDGEPLRGRRLIEVIGDLRGESGTGVALRLSREGRGQPFEVELIREQIQVASIESRLLEPGYGYVRIAQFQAGTGRDFDAALEALVRGNDAPLDGLVLDLRNNPGGVLLASVDVADSLLEKGMIVYTEGRLPSSHLKYRASGEDALNGAPIAVLINAGSASASEIVAGALQDHGRATLIGTRSYGKGSVQSLMPLAGDQAIKLTTAYYYTPNGRSIHHRGIEPDVPFEEPAESGSDEDSAILETALSLLKGATMTAHL